MNIDVFRNNVFVRRNHNQRKARKEWESIKKTLSREVVLIFEIEWNHYLIGEIDVDRFSYYFNDLKIKLLNG